MNLHLGLRQLGSVGNKLVCQCKHGYVQNLFKRQSSSDSVSKEGYIQFYKEDVQTILKNLTGFDLNRIFSQRKLGDKLEPPQYKFMTSEQVQQAFEESEALAKEILQMPPVVPIRKEVDVVLSKDPELIGVDTAKYVFTDISFGKTDRTRSIVVRDVDGTLRKAYWSERRNANQTYFPRPGRQFRVPKMFQLDPLKNVLEREDFLFVLDRACLEFDADDPEYHRVTQATYNVVNEKQAFGTLRFTRHFGPFVFHLVQTKNIDNLLLENLKTERLDDAAQLITLYHIVHPDCASSSSKLVPGQEAAFIKNYIDKDSKLKVALELALMGVKKDEEVSEAVSN